MTIDLLRMVGYAETTAVDFGKFMYLSFRYVLRGPSGTSPARRSPQALPMDANAPQSANECGGLRAVAEGSSRPTHKLNKRKNHRGPAPLSMPFFCNADSFVSHGRFPARDFWPLICGLSPDQMTPPHPSERKPQSHPQCDSSPGGRPRDGTFFDPLFQTRGVRGSA